MRATIVALLVLCSVTLGAASANASANSNTRADVGQANTASSRSPSGTPVRGSQRTFPVAELVTARVTVLRPARIRFSHRDGVEINVSERSYPPQRGRGPAGTMWVEFN